MADANISSETMGEEIGGTKADELIPPAYLRSLFEMLRSSSSPAERIAAARTLSLTGDPRATAHLIAAMFDDDQEVRNAAEEALNLIGERNEFAQLRAKTAEILQEAALAHERIAKDQEEIEQLKTETRTMLTSLRAA